MNKRMKTVFTSIVALIFISGCSDNPIVPIKNDYAFAIYFLKDTTLTIRDIMNTDSYPFITNLKDLKLANKPWLTQDDIEFYEWSSHCIYLKKDKGYFFPGKFELYYQFPQSWKDRPWIVVANGVSCYAGYFFTQASTNFFPFPAISNLHVGLYPTDILTSGWYFWFTSQDIRFNEQVKEALIESGRYHGGVEISIDTTGSPIRVFNDDTTTVEYSLKFKNNDKDNIYIYDPDKIAIYTHGPNFWNITTDESYGPIYQGSNNVEWTTDWYTLLNSGESIKRTIRAKSYPFIPAGTYLVQTGFPAPKERFEKDIRETPLGRYYVPGGQTLTDTLRVTIKP